MSLFAYHTLLLVGGLEHGCYFPNSWDDDQSEFHIFQKGRDTTNLIAIIVVLFTNLANELGPLFLHVV